MTYNFIQEFCFKVESNVLLYFEWFTHISQITSSKFLCGGLGTPADEVHSNDAQTQHHKKDSTRHLSQQEAEEGVVVQGHSGILGYMISYAPPHPKKSSDTC